MKKLFFLVLTILPFLSFSQNCFDNTIIKIEKTIINTEKSDFGAAIVDNNLFYSTLEKTEKTTKKRNLMFYDLYSSPLDDSGNVINNKTLILSHIGEGFHTGPTSYCEETGELFVTLSNFKDPDIKNKIYVKSDIRLKIVTVKNSITEEFPFNDPTYSVGHPAINKTGDTLYFSSNMPNGFGETDLYMSIRTNGEWQTPINLGETINTVDDEMFPTLYKNFLIFSSNHNNSNLDLYYTSLGKFTKPKPLSELNTEFDDFQLVMYKNDLVGYYNSNSQEDISDDIYKITFKSKEVKPEPEPVPVPLVVNQIFTLNNIFYDFDKWYILPESEVELDSLVTVLKEHPELKVELGSHTDCRGSDAYNMILSQKRSDSAVNYIVSKGIPREKIVAKGYGETMLVNKCDDGVWCSEADHRKNRRTEIKILEINK